MSSQLIVLDVGGRKYKTQKITLGASPYFRNLLARWEHCSDKQEDNSYFIDADPDTFQYVLDFMRRPSKHPLYWTKETGFDYALYNKLEAEADYFLLHDLRDWIRKKRYLDAVKTVVEVKVLPEHETEDRWNQKRYEVDKIQKRYEVNEVQSFFGSYSGEKQYRSPCEIHTESDHPIRGCGSCAVLIQAHGPKYDDPPKKLTLVITRVVFDEAVCVNETIS